MAGLPEGFRAKIGRAIEHLDALKKSIADFTVEGESYSVIKEANRESGEYIFRIRVLKEPPLVQWSLIIGDCLHNLRSALDHLFIDLVLRKHPDPKTIKNQRRIQFPLHSESSGFKGHKPQNEEWVGADALAIVERLQPFNHPKGPNFSILGFLHEFDITDKHRLLLPAIQIMDKGEIHTKTVLNKTVTFDGHAVLMGFEDNAVIASLKYRTPEDVVDVDYVPSFNVIFKGQPGPMRVVETLEDCIKAVGGVGNEVLRHLP